MGIGRQSFQLLRVTEQTIWPQRSNVCVFYPFTSSALLSYGKKSNHSFIFCGRRFLSSFQWPKPKVPTCKSQDLLSANARHMAQCANENEKPLYYSEQVKWSPIFPGTKDRVDYAMKLAKFRLTGLVVLTTLAGYVVAPGSMHVIPCLSTVIGTALCSASANAFNQFLEIPYDSQMSRTRNRVLVQGLLRPLEAFLFGTVSGLTGVSLLFAGVNTPTALLGLANIVLYAAVYTPSKRLTIGNTWIGSLVGAIPPIMGWTACTGTLDWGAMALATLLYCWQFPHFNALSWSYRADYSRAGYRMMAVTDPALCRRVTLRHGLALVPLAFLFPLFDVTTWWFAALATPVNLAFAQLSFRFYRSSDNKSARKLFRFSLLNLPILVLLMIFTLKREKTVDEVGAVKLPALLLAAK